MYVSQGCHFMATHRQAYCCVGLCVFVAASSSYRFINAYYLCYCVLGKKASNVFFIIIYCVDVDLVCLASKEEPEAEVDDTKAQTQLARICGMLFVLYFFFSATAPPNSLRRNRSLNFEPNKSKKNNRKQQQKYQFRECSVMNARRECKSWLCVCVCSQAFVFVLAFVPAGILLRT